MVASSNSNDKLNVSGNTPSPIQLLQKLKNRALAQGSQEVKQHGDQEEKESHKKVDEKQQKVVEASRRHQRDLLTTSSDSSERQIYIARRTRIQENIFAQQCKETYNKKKSSYSNAYSSHTTSSESQSPHHRHNTINYNSTYYTDKDKNLKSLSTKGVLHLQGPIQHKINEKMYYEDRGRMEPIDWSIINGNKARVDSNTQTHSLQHQGKDTIPKTIKSSNTLLEMSNVLSNFIHNSCVENIIAFDVRNNINIKSTSDSPLIKLQRELNRTKPVDAIPMTEEVRQRFITQSNKYHVVELIGTPIKKSKAVQNDTSKTTVEIKDESKTKLYNGSKSKSKVTNKLQDYIKSQQEIQVSLNAEINNKENITPDKTKDLRDYQCMESLSTISHQNTPALKNSRRKEFMNYDDDMFNFVKPKIQDSSLSCYNSNDDYLNSDEARSSTLNLYFGKFSKSPKDTLNNSLDSDDTSGASSNDIDNLSISRKSTVSKYELFTKKLNEVSQVLDPLQIKSPRPKLSEIIKNKSVTVAQEEEKESLMRETLTRFLESNDLSVNVEKNTEVINGKVLSKGKQQLKEVSTQCFAQYSSRTKKVMSLVQNPENTNNKVTKSTEINILSDNSKIEISDSANNSVSNNDQIHINKFVKVDDITNNLSIEQAVTDVVKGKEVDEIIDNSKVMIKFIENTENISNLKNNLDISDVVDNSNVITLESDYNTNESIYLSVSNSEKSEELTSAEISSTVVAKINDENFITNNNSFISSDDDYIISNQTNIPESSVIIKEIDPISESDIVNSNPNDIQIENEQIKAIVVRVEDYDNIDSDEEFDIVGCESFINDFTASIKSIQNSINIANQIESSSDIDDYNNNNNNKIKSLSYDKSSDSSFKISDNSSSTASNLDADDEMTSNTTGQSLFFEKDNIFEGINIDDSIWNNERPSYFNSSPKVNENQNQESNRMKKKKNALAKYQENLKKSKEIEVQQNKHQTLNNSMQSRSESSDGSSQPRNWILNQIKEKKLHLKCKPVDKKKLNLFKS